MEKNYVIGVGVVDFDNCFFFLLKEDNYVNLLKDYN